MSYRVAEKNHRLRVVAFSLAVISWLLAGCSDASRDKKPNVIIFYVDDLGYGDVGCYGATRVATPNVDSLASEGIRFTDAHCSSATCTPSRFSLLTGLYAFRNRAEILPGDAPLLIDTSYATLPKMLKKAGYNTAVVGKWHLGLGYGKTDWNKHISPGANEVGFDYSFLIPATGDRVPTVFVENGDVVNSEATDPIQVNYAKVIGDDAPGTQDTALLKMKADVQHSNTVVNGVSRIGYMSGGKKARWIDEDFPLVFNEKAFAFIKSAQDKPFFLFYSFHDIHVPRMPNKRFAGKSVMGPRGDAIAQVDWVVGEIVSFLKAAGKLDNTLIIFTSDNGPVLDDGYADQAEALAGDHLPGGGFRGGKYSAFEAGTRVPTIVYWKGHVTPKVSKAVISQVDLLASLASLVGADLNGVRLDSEDQSQAWLGKNDQGREVLVEESFTLSVRKDNWKYIRPFSGKTPDWLANKGIEGGLSSDSQLYNLNEDPQERHNLSGTSPDRTEALDRELQRILTRP